MKKAKRMQAGGVATPPDRAAKMASRVQKKYGKISARNPGYKPTLPSPVDTKEELKSYRQGLRGFKDTARDAMRDEKIKKRVISKYDRMSSRFPGYKPTLASPVDTRDELKSFRMGLRDYRKANPGVKPVKPMRPGAIAPPVVPVIPPNQPAMRGGGLARKGVGIALAKGGIVKAPARSYKDMRAGAGSGVGRIQKTKIAGRGR